jgi:hypothetical protein
LEINVTWVLSTDVGIDLLQLMIIREFIFLEIIILDERRFGRENCSVCK